VRRIGADSRRGQHFSACGVTPQVWWSFGGHLVVLSGTQWYSLGVAGHRWFFVALSPLLGRVGPCCNQRSRPTRRAAHRDLSTSPPAKVPTNLPNARAMLQREIPASQAAYRLAPRPDPSPSSIASGQAGVLSGAGRKRTATLTMARGEASGGEQRTNGPCLSG